jgi:hypothetical protein
MKRIATLGLPRQLLLLALLALILAACGGSPAVPAPAATAAAPAAAVEPAAPAVAAAPASRLDTSYDGALPQRNQLLLGALRLEDGANALTAEQSAKLLPLWQGIRATMNSGAASEAETSALLAQIEAVLTPEQIVAIGELKLTQASLQEWAKSQGLSVGTGEGAEMGAGSGKSLSPEARATRQAERGVTSSSGGTSAALVDAVIKLLGSK